MMFSMSYLYDVFNDGRCRWDISHARARGASQPALGGVAHLFLFVLLLLSMMELSAISVSVVMNLAF